MKVLQLATVLLIVVGVFGEKADKFKTFLVDKHNELRKQQHGSDMNELVWSDTLAGEADNWLQSCRFEHENKGRGENLAFNTGADDMKNMEQAFKDWYDEINLYNYASKACGASCHYTQLVWHNTREVGCAIKRCPSMSAFGQQIKDGWYFGCWYDPKGNDVSEYPYHKGAECSACLEGQTCSKGLCVGKGKEKCEDKQADCIMWEASGSCESNKAYMEKNCRQACKFCEGGPARECVDKNPNCDKFARTCKTNVAWMKPNCMKTCGFC